MFKKYLVFTTIGVIAVAIVTTYSWKRSQFTVSPILKRGPYIQNVSQKGITIKWKTSSREYGVVRYGTSFSSLDKTVREQTESNDHTVYLTGLMPGTKYFYSVGNESEIFQGDSLNYFVTFPSDKDAGTTNIWIIGDAGSGFPEQNQVRDAYFAYSKNKRPDLWLWLGDNAYETGTEEEYQEKVFTDHFEDIMKNTPVFSCIGNHDMANMGYQNIISQTYRFPYFSIFETPQKGESGGVASESRHYYSFNFRNIHFISLDSYALENDPESKMYRWLKSDLEVNRQRWTIVFFHHPPYTKGTHDSDKEDEMIDMRRNIVPLLEKHSVDLVLSGHSHVYERSFLLNGHYESSETLEPSMIIDNGKGNPESHFVKEAPDFKGTVYMVVGNSGKGGGRKEGWPHPVMAYSTSDKMGSVKLEINGDTLMSKFIDSNAKVQDEFRIIKSGV